MNNREKLLELYQSSNNLHSRNSSCIKTNRRFIGCELDKEYFNLACNRIDTELKQGNLF